MELLLLNINSDVEQIVSDLCRTLAFDLHTASDIDAALEQLRAAAIDVVILSPVAIGGTLLSTLIRTCRSHGASVVLLLDDLACLHQLDEHTRDQIDDFLLLPYEDGQLAARLDLISRRRRGDALRRAILRALPDIMFRIHRDGTYVDFQAPDPTRLYMPSERIVGTRVTDALPAVPARRCLDALEEVLDTGMPAYFEYSLPLADGTRYFEARMVSSGPDEALALIRDVTERKRAEEQIRTAALAKQAFASRVLSVQESERQHLSRELHDSISQLLLVHRMDAEWLAKEAEGGPVREAAEHLCTALDETLHLVRTLAMDLRPPAIDDLGIDSALETLCVDITRRSGIHCEFESDGHTRSQSSEVGVTLYRIAQEALANAVRHAKCRSIRVQLVQHGNSVELQVADDGVGIDPRRLADTASFGLVGMRERAELVGGHVTIETGPDDGTCIRATVPHTPYRPTAGDNEAPISEGES